MVLSRRKLLQYGGLLGLGLGSSAVLPKWAAAADAVTMPLTMQLDWKFNVQFTGLLLADYQGLYTDQGLEVAIKPWESGMVVPDQVVADPMTIGCAEQNLILSAQAEGAPIRAIATMLQASPLALMTLPESGIATLDDLVGKTVGIHVDGLEVMELVKSVSDLAPEAIEVVEIPYDDKYERLLSGELAAIQCYAVDEPIGFKAQSGIEPVIIRLSDYGYEAYAQVIFAHTDLLMAEPEAVKGFLGATFGGWQMALADIPGSVQVVVDNYVDPESKYNDMAYQTRSLELIADYMLLDIEPDMLGTIDMERWMRMAQRFADFAIIEAAPEESLMMDFWPQST